MQQPSPAGLKTILPRVVRSFLADAPALPYNWSIKFDALVLGICLARSLVLQTIAQTRKQRVKLGENALSKFLGQDRLRLHAPQRACVINVLKRLGSRRLLRYKGKVVLIVDPTAYAKARSRGKTRPMPRKGKVRLHNLRTNETVLVPGYQELWIGVLLKDRTVLPITRRLWTENGPDCVSQNLVELAELRKARDLIEEALGLDAILVADSGFRRKDLLHWLKKSERMDFVIRLEGRLTVFLDEVKGLLEEAAPWWKKRVRIQWREGSKRVLLSDVSARQVTVATEGQEWVSFNVLCLTPENERVEPMFLATTLTTETVEELRMIVRLYSWRWGIETYFWKFKQAFRGASWRVFGSWDAIDRLLTAAHMAYLVLVVIAEFVRQGRAQVWLRLRQVLRGVLRERFAGSPEMTLGRFFRLIAMDFPSPERFEVLT